jgi:hypothetical protein
MVAPPRRKEVPHLGALIAHAPSGSRAAALLRLAAATVGRTDTALGAFYRRLSARIGKAKAVTATARKIAVLFYNAVQHGMEYVDPGASSYETRYRARVIDNLHRRAKVFGFVLQPIDPTPQQRADVAQARRRWMREQGVFDPARLVFIDETSANTKMARRWQSKRAVRASPCTGVFP